MGEGIMCVYDLQFYQLQLEKSQELKCQFHHPW